VFDSHQVYEIFLSSLTSEPPLGPTQPPIQWVREDLSPGVKRPGREADHSSPSSVEVKNGRAITSIYQVQGQLQLTHSLLELSPS
jgi:hypothetical protein